MTKQQIMEAYPDVELLTADGFDEAIIGLDAKEFRVVYSVQKCLNILIGEGMTLEEAEEHFEYNVLGAYVGEKTPIFMHE